jgi:hypothetical protein
MDSELSKRIAAALSSDVSSAEVAALIVELVAAVSKSDEAAVAEHITGVDPLTSPGPGSGQIRLPPDDACYSRLRCALPSLQLRLAELQAAEYATAWEKNYERVRAQIEDAARKWTEYPKLIAQLVDILDTTALDQMVSRVNSSAPKGEQRRLHGVELTARNLQRFDRYHPSIARGVQLPELKHSYKMAWPPRPQALAAAYAALTAHSLTARGAPGDGSPD